MSNLGFLSGILPPELLEQLLGRPTTPQPSVPTIDPSQFSPPPAIETPPPPAPSMTQGWLPQVGAGAYGNQLAQPAPPAQGMLPQVGGGFGNRLTPERPAVGADQLYQPPVIGAPATVPQEAPEIAPRTLQGDLEEIDSPTRFDKPTHQNTDPSSPDFGTQSNDPKVVKTWGNNAARIDQGGKGRNKKWSLLEKIGSAALGWAQGGLAGGIRAGTDRNYFQKISDEQKRSELVPKIAAGQAIAKRNLEAQNLQNQITARTFKTKAEIDGIANLMQSRIDKTDIDRKRLTKELDAAKQLPIKDRKDFYKSIWTSSPTWDKKNNPEHKAISDWMAKNDAALPDKAEKPTNQGIDLDEKTSFGMFGIDDDAIKTQAAAKVGKGAVATDWDPNWVKDLPAKFKHADGKFNQEAFQAAAGQAVPDPDTVKIDPSRHRINLPDNYEQRLASETDKLRKGQETLRNEAASFRAALKTHRPRTDAIETTTVDRAAQLLKMIMSQPPSKERDERRRKFYDEYLPSVKFQ